MDVTAAPVHEQLRRPWPAWVSGGLAAGTLDIAAACIQSGLRGIGPARVFRAIASGVQGPPAFQGGAGTAALGLFLHYVIAFGAAGVFVLAARQWRALARHAVVAGAAYGVVVYLVMKYIIVPASRFPSRGNPIDLVQVAIHIFCVGLPIGLAVHHYLAAPKTA